MHSIRFTIFDAAPERPVLRCFGRDGRLVGDRPLVRAEVDAFVAEVEAEYRAVAPDLLGLGRRLFQWLDGPTERWLASAREQPGTLVVEIDGDERLRHLPWELLADGSFLTADPVRPIVPVRLVRRPAPELTVANRPLRVLFMASSPENVTPVLSYEEEEARLLQATAKSPLELEVEESGSLAGLGERLDFAGSDFFDVVHLTGHATVQDGQPLFLLEGEVGEPTPATPEDVAALFVAGWPSLVFLSGCRTGEAPGRGAVPSFAEQLLLAGAPAVLAWALPVGDQSATVAAAEIYQHLATGRTAAEAAIRARVELRKSGSPYWHLLRFYGEAKCLAPRVTPPGAKGRPRLVIRPVAKQLVEAGGSFEVCPRERFIGRRREIQRCLRTLRAQQDAEIYRDGVLLHGMGGLGKSSLAVRLVERLSRTHTRLLCVGRLDETRLLQPFNETLQDADAIARLGDARLPLRNRLAQLLEGPLVNQPTLFVLDDFEHNVEADEDKAPRLDPAGRAILQAEPLAVLTALLGAIRDTGSASRVIVTCRYRFALPAPLALWEETPPTLRGADLGKKLGQLTALGPRSQVPKETKERATTLAAGNPRLLEHLDRALLDNQTQTESLFERLEQTAQAFRENVILEALLQRLEPTGRQLLAFLGLFQLPIDRPILQATADALPLEPHLTKALALGLAEQTREPGGQAELYFTSAVLQPVLEGVATEEDLKAAAGRAARYLAPLWWEDRNARSEVRSLQLHQLALRAPEGKLAANVAVGLVGLYLRKSQFRDAARLSESTLAVVPDPRLYRGLARAQQAHGSSSEAFTNYDAALQAQSQIDRAKASHAELQELADVLHDSADLYAQRGDIPQALLLCQQSLEVTEQIGDAQGKAATLHQLANLHAQRGDLPQALHLYQQAFEIQEQIGDARGKAATLAQLGYVNAQRGDLPQALHLYQQALEIQEQIGNAQGKAAILHQLAGLHAQRGDISQALLLYQQSLEINEQIGDAQGKAATLAQLGYLAWQSQELGTARSYFERAARVLAEIQAWPNLAQVLGNLSFVDEPRKTSYLAQPLWLALRVATEATALPATLLFLFQQLDPTSNAALHVAAAAPWLVARQAEHHSERGRLVQEALVPLAALAEARGIAPDSMQPYLAERGLDDPARLLPLFEQTLESLVPEGEWAFDRSLLPPLQV